MNKQNLAKKDLSWLLVWLVSCQEEYDQQSEASFRPYLNNTKD